MVFRDVEKDGTTRLTGGALTKSVADGLYLPKYQEYDSGWIYVNGQGTNPSLVGGNIFGGTHGMPRFRRIGDVVWMEGLINNPPASPGTIFTLPAGFRPDGDIIPFGAGNVFPENHAIKILANGQVQTGTGVTGYASLVCQFPIASAANPWHLFGDPGEPAFGAGWSNLGAPWQTARYMKIGDYVYLQGIVQRTTGSNNNIFTLPANLQPPDGTTHTPCASTAGLSGADFGVNISTTITARASGSQTGYLSLSGIRYYAGPANDAKWRKFRGGADGYWTGTSQAYGSPWPLPAIRRDGKIIHLEGLLNISAAAIFAKLPWGFAPGQLLIHSGVQATTRRMDVSSPNEDNNNWTASSLQAFATGVLGLTHSWVVSEEFEGDIRWNS
jgi:hypothetical protein